MAALYIKKVNNLSDVKVLLFVAFLCVSWSSVIYVDFRFPSLFFFFIILHKYFTVLFCRNTRLTFRTALIHFAVLGILTVCTLLSRPSILVHGVICDIMHYEPVPGHPVFQLRD